MNHFIHFVYFLLVNENDFVVVVVVVEITDRLLLTGPHAKIKISIGKD